MINTVIFDMDGLLVDSEPLWGLAMQEVFNTVGVTLTPDLWHKTTGLRTKEVVSYWHHHFQWTAKSEEQVTDEIISTVIRMIIAEGRSMEGLHYILDFFKERQFKIGLASSSPKRLIDAVVDNLGISPYFQAVASAEFEDYGKPHPAVYLACAKALGSMPLECIAFEDSITGMTAAKAARMTTVVVPEAHNRQDPRYALANLKLNSLLEFNDASLLAIQALK
ncbi:hexitol phosphatase HxpB [Chitinophaga sp. Cy-1792]|uniref:hexitol phosphatase HxpB n=1 Tax=Chitinophaga sp. Cy-1792 TaxID=2608339 RepID=UPI001421D9B6|nr:hexitol phosphatase HxpB [Chitinophaga sp. Cy-1792]NIG53445.1 hexitol phosphatase HxpB [Chitinophaga sp. Cy-1792]